jgi:hypothetical protein
VAILPDLALGAGGRLQRVERDPVGIGYESDSHQPQIGRVGWRLAFGGMLGGRSSVTGSRRPCFFNASPSSFHGRSCARRSSHRGRNIAATATAIPTRASAKLMRAISQSWLIWSSRFSSGVLTCRLSHEELTMWPTLPRITPAAKIRRLDEDGRARYVIEKERAEQVRPGSVAQGHDRGTSGH